MNSVLTQNDTDELKLLLPHITLDRKQPRPIYEQLRTAIEFAIFSGHIPDRSPLPSVRLLANALEVAPNTVVRAYHGLEQEGLIKSSPKRGYFVVLGVDWPGDAETSGDPGTREVVQFIDAAVQAARKSEMEHAAFIRLVIERTRTVQSLPRVVAVVSYREAFLDERTRFLAEALADLTDVQVIGISFQDLRNPLAEQVPALESIDCFLVPVGEVQEASILLGASANRIVPMTRTLRPDLQSLIANQPDATRFGVITGRQEHVGRVIANLRELHPLRVPPVFASIAQPDEVEHVISAADFIVIGTRARPFFDQYGAIPKPSVEIISFPDDTTLRRIRNYLKYQNPNP